MKTVVTKLIPIMGALVLFVVLLGGVSAFGQDDESWSEGLYFSGYGDVLYSHFDFGPDQKSGSNGSPADNRAIVDLQRFVLGVGYDFDDTWSFQAEIEFEHGGTGGTLELEYEEFGEYEQEVEKGGEVVLEQLHLTKIICSTFNLRVGHIIVPVGSINSSHLPISHFGTVRPESESTMIPVTWHETGMEVFGGVGDFGYQVLLINGLDSTGFDSKYWVRGGRQTKFEQVSATDLALASRVTWRGLDGLALSFSGYFGNTTGNRPKPDMDGISGNLVLLGSDLRYGRGPLRIRAAYLFGSLENADQISRKNSRLSTNLGVSRTPVAKAAQSFGIEMGYDVMPQLSSTSDHALLPFLRYEEVNTMQETDSIFFADPRFDRRISTLGVNWFPRPTIVVKADYSIRSFGADRYRNESTFGLSLGWVY